MKRNLPQIKNIQHHQKSDTEIIQHRNLSFNSIDTTIQYVFNNLFESTQNNSNDEIFPSLVAYSNSINTLFYDRNTNTIRKRIFSSFENKAIEKIQREFSHQFPNIQIRQFLGPVQKPKPYHNNLPIEAQTKIQQIKKYQLKKIMDKRYFSLEDISNIAKKQQPKVSPYIETHRFTSTLDVHKYMDSKQQEDFIIQPPIDKLNRYDGLLQLQDNRLVLASKRKKPPMQIAYPSVQELAISLINRQNSDSISLLGEELIDEKNLLKKHQESQEIHTSKLKIPKNNLNELHTKLIAQVNQMDQLLKKDIKQTQNKIRKNQFKRLQLKQKRGLRRIDEDLVNVLSQMHDDSFIKQLKNNLSK